MKRLTLYIAAAIIIVFMLQQFYPSVTDSFKLVSSGITARPWTLVTSIFLHSGAVHLFYNLFGLVLFGLILESIIGAKRLAILFFASGILGGIAASFFYDSALGASAAIFGIIGALAVLRPMMVVWAYYLPMPMFIATAVWASGDLLGLIIPSDIANAAHLAGLGLGIAAGFMMRGRKPLFTRGRSEVKAMTDREFDEWEREYMLKK